MSEGACHPICKGRPSEDVVLVGKAQRDLTTSPQQIIGRVLTEPAEPHHLKKAETKLVPLNIQIARRNYCMAVRILNRISGKGQLWQTSGLKANKYCNFVINGNITL